MHVTDRRVGDITIVKLAGTLDAATAPAAEAQLSILAAGNPVRFVLDLSELWYMTSAGIRVLQKVTKEARRQSGDVRLAQAQPNVVRTLELVGLIPVINVYADVESAIASFA